MQPVAASNSHHQKLLLGPKKLKIPLHYLMAQNSFIKTLIRNHFLKQLDIIKSFLISFYKMLHASMHAHTEHILKYTNIDVVK